MEPSSQSHPASQCANLRKRYREMCQRCRNDKQRCEPPNRDWEVSQEKCQRCIELGHPCGPSQRAERKPRKRRATITENTARFSEGTRREDVSAVPIESTRDRFTEGHLRSRSDPTHRPVVAWVEPGSVTASSCTRSASISLATSMPSSFHDNLIEGRRLLARLEDHLALIELFRLEYQWVEDVSAWTGPDKNVTSSKIVVQSTIDGLKRNTRKYIQSARRLIEQDLGSIEAKECFMQNLCSVEYKYHNALCQDSMPSNHRQTYDSFDFDSTSRSRRSLYNIQREAGFGSALYCLYGEIASKPSNSPCVHAGGGSEIVADHFTASKMVTETLAQISFDDVSIRDAVLGLHSKHKPLDGSKLPLPPCHLGALQDNPNVLLKLWQNCGQIWELDFLHRTPVHIGAYAGNLSSFHQIFERNPYAAARPGLDYFGLSPLMITACRDDLEGYTLLSKHGASDKELHKNRSILALAARNGSKKVVQHMLAEPDSILFSPCPEVSQAIEAGHQDVAQIFIDHFNRQSIVAENDIQILSGIQTARQKGFRDIVTGLETVKPNIPNLQHALNTCNSVNYEQDYLSNSAGRHPSNNFGTHMSAVFSQELDDQTGDWMNLQDGFTSPFLYPDVQTYVGDSSTLW